MTVAALFLASPFWLALLSGAAVLLTYRGWMIQTQARAGKSALETRIKEFQRQSTLADETMASTELSDAGSPGLLRRFGLEIRRAFFTGESSRSFLDAIDDRLTLAGNPNGWISTDLVAFCALIIGSVAFFGGSLVRAGLLPVFIYLPLVALCCAYPYVFLNAATRQRKDQAFAELPYFLDQLILELSSGTSTLDSAIRNVVMDDAEMKRRPRAGSVDSPSSSRGDRDRVLAKEFRRAYLETANQVHPFATAYRAAAARIQVQEVDDLVDVFVSGDATGSPILGTLQTMSKHIYTVFEQNMATLIKKKDTTFTIATVIIMISTAILIATPIIVTVIGALSGQVGAP